MRMYWVYGPDQQSITIIGLEPHPEDKKNGAYNWRSDANSYGELIWNIGSVLETGKKQAVSAVNQAMVRTYWEIGKYIVEYEQAGMRKRNMALRR